MFSNIKHGWATFSLGDFIGRCSYLTDPIIDIAQCLFDGSGLVKLDGEGPEYDLIISEYPIYIVSHNEKHELHMTDLSLTEFAKLFIESVTNNMQAWIDWFGYTDKENIAELQQKRQSEINSALNSVKEKYKI